MKRRYRLIVEIEEDGKVIRRMLEERDKLSNDFNGGEHTMGYLLSFVPAWIGEEHGTDGLATLACMCSFLPCTSDPSANLWKQLGEAYDRWGAAHDFHHAITSLDLHARVALTAMVGGDVRPLIAGRQPSEYQLNIYRALWFDLPELE